MIQIKDLCPLKTALKTANRTGSELPRIREKLSDQILPVPDPEKYDFFHQAQTKNNSKSIPFKSFGFLFSLKKFYSVFRLPSPVKGRRQVNYFHLVRPNFLLRQRTKVKSLISRNIRDYKTYEP